MAPTAEQVQQARLEMQRLLREARRLLDDPDKQGPLMRALGPMGMIVWPALHDLMGRMCDDLDRRIAAMPDADLVRLIASAAPSLGRLAAVVNALSGAETS